MDYGKDLSNVIDVSEMGKNVVQIMQGLIMIGLMFFETTMRVLVSYMVNDNVVQIMQGLIMLGLMFFETTMRVLVSYNVGFGLCIPCLYYCTINKVKDLK